MVQIVRLIADVSVGNWTKQDLGATNLYTVVDETIADDTDYIRVTNPNNDVYIGQWGPIGDPATGTGHIYRYELVKIGADVVDMTVSLYEGTTEIASWTHYGVTTMPTAYAQTLTSTQANSISDYSALRLRVWATINNPGPVAPDSVANLGLWLKADAITSLVNGDPVTTWDDQTTNNLDAVGAGATRPTYQTNVINGLPVVRFQVDDILTTAADNFGATGAITVFLVASNIATGADRMLLEHGANVNSTEGAWSLARNNTNTATAGVMRHQSAGLFASMESAAASNQVLYLGASPLTARLVTVRFDRSLGQQEATVWINGLYGGSAEGNGTFRANDNDLGGTFPGSLALNVGNRSGSATLGANGDIGEVLVYERALTSRERTRIEMWLMDKWDLVN